MSQFHNNKGISLVFDRTKEYNKNLLTAEEEKKLIKAYQENGDMEAYEKIFYSNLRLVYHFVKKFYTGFLSIDDLFQEGCIGLQTAIEKFDCDFDKRFSTYASLWIKQKIGIACSTKNKDIHVPESVRRMVVKYNNSIMHLREVLNRYPEMEEIASYMNIDMEELKQIIAASMLEVTISIDSNTKNSDKDDKPYFEKVLSDSKAVNPENVIDEISNKQLLYNMLEILPERERQILLLRYGFIDNRVYTLEEVGNIFGITKERVRQLEKIAFDTIRKAGTNKSKSRDELEEIYGYGIKKRSNRYLTKKSRY